MDTLPKTAVIIPCYNEADRLKGEIFLKAIDDYRNLDFVFVNDGSKDLTQKVLEGLRAYHPDRISLLNLTANQGKSEAIRQGFLLVMKKHYDYLGYWDADLATPLDTIPRFRQILEVNTNILITMGARVKLLGREIHRKRVRHYLGRIFATFVGLILQCEVYDSQCGAKLFRNTEAIQKIFVTPFISKWIFDVEIIARLSEMLKASGEDIKNFIIEYPLEQWTDVNGSKLKPRHYAVVGIDLAKIALKYSH